MARAAMTPRAPAMCRNRAMWYSVMTGSFRARPARRGRGLILSILYVQPNEGVTTMARRRYRMQARRTSAERTRGKIVGAARALLSARSGIGAFTIDAVARAAGV